MSMSESRERWQRAALAGGRPITDEAWAKIVEHAVAEATTELRLMTRTFMDDRPQDSAFMRHRFQHVTLKPGDIVVSARDVLGVEMRLIEASRMTDLVMELAQDDIDESRRARLCAAFEKARARVEHEIKRRGES